MNIFKVKTARFYWFNFISFTQTLATYINTLINDIIFPYHTLCNGFYATFAENVILYLFISLLYKINIIKGKNKVCTLGNLIILNFAIRGMCRHSLKIDLFVIQSVTLLSLHYLQALYSLHTSLTSSWWLQEILYVHLFYFLNMHSSRNFKKYLKN